MAARRRVPGGLRVIALVGMCAFAGVACGSGSSSTRSGPANSTPARPATPATLEIVAPGPNEHTARIVDVDVQLQHAQLVPGTQVGGILRPDRGHIHLSVDGRLVAMPSRLHDRLPRLAPGPHTLQAEFVASDHLPFANRVVAAVTFIVG